MLFPRVRASFLQKQAQLSSCDSDPSPLPTAACDLPSGHHSPVCDLGRPTLPHSSSFSRPHLCFEFFAPEVPGAWCEQGHCAFWNASEGTVCRKGTFILSEVHVFMLPPLCFVHVTTEITSITMMCMPSTWTLLHGASCPHPGLGPHPGRAAR